MLAGRTRWEVMRRHCQAPGILLGPAVWTGCVLRHRRVNPGVERDASMRVTQVFDADSQRPGGERDPSEA